MHDSDTGDPQHPEMVLFQSARSPFEARIIVAVLEDAGIPAFVPGGLLTDEFAISRQLANAQNVDVHVPGDRLEDARQALAAAKQSAAANMPEERVEPPPPDPQPPSTGAVAKIALGILALLLALLWLQARAELNELRSYESPLYVPEDRGEPGSIRWRHNGALAFVIVDRNGDGVSERIDTYDRDGHPTTRAVDADENGIFERITAIGADGREVSVADDADQDGRYETIRDDRGGDLTVIWLDADDDGFHERAELHRGAEGVLVQQFDREAGFVTVR